MRSKLRLAPAILALFASLISACSGDHTNEASPKVVDQKAAHAYRQVLNVADNPTEESIIQLIQSEQFLEIFYVRVDSIPDDILEALNGIADINSVYMPQPTEYLALLMSKNKNTPVNLEFTKAVMASLTDTIQEAKNELTPWIKRSRQILVNELTSEALVIETPPLCPVGRCAKIKQLPDAANFGGYFGSLWLYLKIASPKDAHLLNARMVDLKQQASEAFLLFEEIKSLKVTALERERRRNPVVEEPKKKLTMKDLGKLAGETYKEGTKGISNASDKVKKVFKPINDFTEGFSEGSD